VCHHRSLADKHRPEVRLDPALQERILEQMREEQRVAIRNREIRNWVLVPTAIFSLVIGIVLMFSENLAVAVLANIVTSGIATVLWRTNRDWIRNTFGA
jgi:hypothetical protein